MSACSSRFVLPVALFVALLAPSAYLAWLGRDLPHLGYFQDDGLYWIGAKSIAEGRGYRILSFPGQPFQTKYPPAYSLCLSGIWKLDPEFPHNLRWALLVTWLTLPVYLLLSQSLLARTEVPKNIRRVTLVLLALSPTISFLAVNLLSDLMFSGLVFGALIAAERVTGKDVSGSMWAVAAGILAGMAYLTRTAAISVIIAIVSSLLMRKHFRATALYTMATLPAVVGWNYWMQTHRSPLRDFTSLYYTDYFGLYFINVSLSDVPHLVVTNIRYLLRAAGSLVLFNPADSAAVFLFCTLVAAAAVAGIVARVKRTGFRIYDLFTALYALELIAWHYPPNERFLLPILPLLAAGFAQTIWQTVAGGPPFHEPARRPRWAKVSMAAGVAGIAVLWLAGVRKGTCEVVPEILASHREQLLAYRSASRLLPEYCPEHAPLIAYQDTLAYLYSGYLTLRLVVPSIAFYRADAAELWRPFREVASYAERYSASCLLTTSGDYHTAAVISDHAAMEAIFRNNERLRLVLQLPDVRIYRVEWRDQ